MGKKVILVVCLVGLLTATLVAGYLYWNQRKKEVSVGDMIPGGALLYARVSDPGVLLKRLGASRAWNILMGIDFDALVEQGLITSQQRARIQKIRQVVEVAGSNAAVRKFVPKDLVVAVYPVELDFHRVRTVAEEMSRDILQEVLKGVTVVVRLGPEGRLMDQVVEWLRDQPNVSIDTEEYQGNPIHKVALPALGAKLCFTRLKNFVVAGVGPAAAKKAIDVVKGRRPSLRKDTRFQAAQRQFLERAEISGFVDIEDMMATAQLQSMKLAEWLQKQDSRQGDRWMEARKRIQESVEELAGLKLASFSIVTGEVIQQKYTVSFDQGKLSKEFAAIYNCPGVVNASLKMIPRDALGYRWNNCMPFAYYLEKLKNGWKAPRNNGPLKGLNALSPPELLGNLLPALGDELGGYVWPVAFTSLPMLGEVPVPDGVLFVEVKDRARLESLIARWTANPMVSLKNEIYKGVALSFLEFPVQGIQKPGFCFLDKYFLLAVNKDRLEQSIDVYQSGSESIQNDLRQLTGASGEESLRSIYFVKVEDTVDSFQGVLEWATQRRERQDQQKIAFEEGSRQRLRDLQASIEETREGLAQLNQQIERVDQEIQALEARHLETRVQKQERDRLVAEREKKLKVLESDYDREAELREIVKGYDQRLRQVKQRRIFVEEVIGPVLEALATVKSAGGRTVFHKGMMDGYLQLDFSR